MQGVAIDPGSLADAIERLATFLLPHVEAARESKSA
jgi:hypothetical protein